MSEVSGLIVSLIASNPAWVVPQMLPLTDGNARVAWVKPAKASMLWSKL